MIEVCNYGSCSLAVVQSCGRALSAEAFFVHRRLAKVGKVGSEGWRSCFRRVSPMAIAGPTRCQVAGNAYSLVT